MSLALKDLLPKYQRDIDTLLEKRYPPSENRLQEACRYALTQGGKRFRPALVMMVAEALGKRNDVIDAAIAVECFHTASLIADDLPCMDDDRERRGKPSTHMVFGEAIALLASYALIADGYQALGLNTEILKRSGHPLADSVGMLALKHAARTTGKLGATGGQYLDLFPPALDLATYQETVVKKTVALFEISMILGWLFGGGDLEKVSLVSKAAHHYGMAFQMADDLGDAQEDAQGARKMNAVNLLGFDETERMFHGEISAYLIALKELKLNSPALTSLAEYLQR